MATGGSPRIKDTDFQNSCSLCFETYGEERTPKMLSCFHTFCAVCLSVLEASVAMEMPDNGTEDNQQAADEKDTAAEPDTGSESAEGTNISDDVIAGSVDTPNTQFRCPTCRVPVHLPEGGVAALQTNFYLSYDVPMCDACPKGSQQRADVFCQDCDKHLCPPCRCTHDKWTSGHHVTALSLGQPGKARSEKKAFCSVHQDQTLCFHCRQCDTGICVMCKLTTHEGHPASDIASAVVQAKSELPSLLTEATRQLQVVQTSIRHTERQERHLSHLAQNLTRQINTRYDLLVAAITQSRDELLEELSDREEQARSQLQSERNSASVSADTLSGLVSRASCASGNDVISIKKELQAALLSEDLLNHHRQQTVRQDSWPGWTYDVPEVSAVPATACMGRVVEAGADDVNKPPSMAELVDKLGRLENDMTKTVAKVTQNTAEINTISNSMKKRADKMGNAGTMVSFHAWVVNKRRTRRNRPVVFKKVTENEGGGYQEDTGEFMAPVAGTYIFSAGVIKNQVDPSSDQSGDVVARIMVDGTAYASLVGSLTCTETHSLSLRLYKGQTVWLKACFGFSDDYDGSTSYFTGALVNPQR